MEYRFRLIEDGVVIQNSFSINGVLLVEVENVCYGPGLFVYKPNLFSGN
jgi:hypothetical protein